MPVPVRMRGLMESKPIKLHLGDTKGIWPDLAFCKIITGPDDVAVRPVLPQNLYYLEPDSLEIAKTSTKPGEECGGIHVSLRIDLPDGSVALVVMRKEVFRKAARSVLGRGIGPAH